MLIVPCERESQRRFHRARPSQSCSDSFHKTGTPEFQTTSTKWLALDPEQIQFRTPEVSWPTHRQHIVWPRLAVASGTRNLPREAPSRFGTRALRLRSAGQFIRLGDHVFAKKTKTHRSAMCKLYHVHKPSSPSAGKCHTTTSSPERPTTGAFCTNPAVPSK